MLLLESCLQTCMTYTIAECTVNKLLMIDIRIVRNIYSFMTKNLWNWCIYLVLLQSSLLRCTVTWTLKIISVSVHCRSLVNVISWLGSQTSGSVYITTHINQNYKWLRETRRKLPVSAVNITDCSPEDSLAVHNI